MTQGIRVMLVDDAVVVRGLLRRILEREADMQVVASCGDGEAAVQQYPVQRPDIVVMDIEMPRMNGLDAVKHILRMDSDARIVMCSSLTRHGAEATLQALEAGALDYLGKPSAQTIEPGQDFGEALVGKLRALNKRNPAVHTAASASPAQAAIASAPTADILPALRPEVVAIGASTGGPKALAQLLSCWRDNPPDCPILITQHMPAGFTQQLAANLSRATGMDVREAEDGMPLRNGQACLAPGGRHLTLTREGNTPPQMRLSDAPPVHFCRPSVDVMLNSLPLIYSRGILAIILTGMGEDGKDGCRTLRASSAENIVLVQDEASSVVWGMPGAVAKAGYAHAIMPPEGIAAQVTHLLRQGKVLS